MAYGGLMGWLKSKKEPKKKILSPGYWNGVDPFPGLSEVEVSQEYYDYLHEKNRRPRYQMATWEEVVELSKKCHGGGEGNA